MNTKRYYVILRNFDGNEIVIRSFSKRSKAVMFIMKETKDRVVTYWNNSDGDTFYNIVPHKTKRCVCSSFEESNRGLG